MRKNALLWGLAAASAGFFWWEDNALSVTRAECASPRLPAAFDGFRILQVSDLHNKRFGRGQARLLGRIRAERPDLVVLTGDLIDKRRTTAETLAPAFEFLDGVRAIAPVCSACGNHEQAVPALYALLRARMRETGVLLLDDAGVTLSRGGGRLSILGLRDRSCFFPGPRAVYPRTLAGLCARHGGYRVLLSHRPDLIRLYAAQGVDLVFSGHAHGGQVRLPLVGGLYAPHQGLFPPYTAGLQWVGGTALAVSRGLGNSLFPLRCFDRPDLVSVTLRRVVR